MTNKMIVASSLVIICLSPQFAAAQPDNRRLGKLDDRHGWLSNYRAAKTLAKKTGKPMMVVFRCVP